MSGRGAVALFKCRAARDDDAPEVAASFFTGGRVRVASAPMHRLLGLRSRWVLGGCVLGLAVGGFIEGLSQGGKGPGLGVVIGCVAGFTAERVWERVVGDRELRSNARATRRLFLAPLVPAARSAEGPQSLLMLLTPNTDLLPLLGRARDLDALTAWCEMEDGPRVGLVVGPAGAGKNRLALAVATALEEVGWECGWLREGGETAAEAAMQALIDSRDPTLVLVDDAETRPGIARLIGLFADHHTSPSLRMLLLVRHPGDTWNLRDEHRVLAGRPVVDLNEPEWTADDRQRWFEQAVHAFSLARQTPSPRSPRLVEDDPQSPFLYVIAAALVAVSAHENGGPDAVRVSARAVAALLLDHECRHYWRPSAAAAGLTALAEDEIGLQRVVGTACLLPVETEEEAIALLRRLRDVDLAASGVPGVAHWLRRLYPSPAQERRYFGALSPDLLAEHLAVVTLVDCPVLLGVFADPSSAAQSKRALSLLIRAGSHHDDAPRVLTAAIRMDTARLLPVAITLAVLHAAARPIDMALAELLSATPLVLTTVDDLLAEVDGLDTAQVLGQTSIRLHEMRVSHLRNRGPRQYLGEALGKLGVALSKGGRDDSAVEVAEEAVKTWRQLKNANSVFEPELAGELLDLSTILQVKGEWTRALDAVDEAERRYRHLADLSVTYRPNFATALANRGLALSRVGRYEEALANSREGTEVWRSLVRGNGDHEDDLASALGNLSLVLGKTGAYEEALSAATTAEQMWDRLAGMDPIHIPDHATALDNLSSALDDLGLHSDANDASVKAVDLLRPLAERNHIYKRQLATALANLSRSLLRLGQLEAALGASEQAVGRWTRMTLANPNYEPYLASAIECRAAVLSRMARFGEAKETCKQAVEIWRGLAIRHDVHTWALASTLDGLGVILGKAKEFPEAVEALDEARDLCERRDAMTTAQRAIHAAVLTNYAVALIAVGRNDDASSTRQKVLALWSALGAESPKVFGGSQEKARSTIDHASTVRREPG